MFINGESGAHNTDEEVIVCAHSCMYSLRLLSKPRLLERQPNTHHDRRSQWLLRDGQLHHVAGQQPPSCVCVICKIA